MWKPRILFTLTCIVAWRFALVFSDTSISFTILYILGIMLVLSAVSAALAPAMIEIRQQTDVDTIFKDESMSYKLTIRNRSIFFYPRVQYSFYSSELLSQLRESQGAYSLSPWQRLNSGDELNFTYRGLYKIGIQSAFATDFLGLFKIPLRIPSPDNLWVYPKADPDFQLSLMRGQQSTALTSDLFDEDYTSVADVRTYEPGDNLKKIHWKLSAKHRELLVKNFNSFDPNHTVLLLDTQFTDPPFSYKKDRIKWRHESSAVEDKIISYAASAAQYCIAGRLPGELVYGCGKNDTVIIDPEGDIDNLYRILAEISFTPQSPLENYSNLIDITGQPLNMLVFTADLNGNSFKAIAEMISFGHSVLLYSFHPPSSPQTDSTRELSEQLRSLGARVNEIDVAGGDVV